MGLLDDAIREHLELKRRSGAAAEEVTRLEHEAFGPGAVKAAAAPEAAPEPAHEADPVDLEPVPVAAEPEPVAAEPEPVAGEPEPVLAEPEPQPESEFWLDEPDEVPAEESLEHKREHPSDFVVPDDEPESEDVLEETPEFLSETPEHDRLWFEQKPPRDFDFGG